MTLNKQLNIVICFNLTATTKLLLLFKSLILLKDIIRILAQTLELNFHLNKLIKK